MINELKNAKWIGSPIKGSNTAVIGTYTIEADVNFTKDGAVGFLINARDLDNYLELSIEKSGTVKFLEHTDEAWYGSSKDGFGKKVIEIACTKTTVPDSFHLTVAVDKRWLTVKINDAVIIDGENLIPENVFNKPRREYLLNFGISGYGSICEIDNLKIVSDTILLDQTRTTDAILISSLRGNTRLINPVPSVYLKKSIKLDTIPAKAEILSTARGFYECFVNGVKVGEEFFAPGFTDYRLRMDVQKNDITSLLRKGENEITAIVSKGYYTGFCGYSGAENYGKENAFLASIIIEDSDGNVTMKYDTDDSWLYSPCCPVQYADFQDGEYHDCEIGALSKKPEAWEKCGIKEDTKKPTPTNGEFDENVEFSLSLQNYYGAHVLETIAPVKCYEMPKGHFVYDFGQNIVGSVKVQIAAPKGTQIKFRFGEMCYQNGEVYVVNLRTAGNTDVFVIDDIANDTYIPSHTAHGFRYLEITGNGYDLESADIVKSVEGLVICNLKDTTGYFECSDPLINRLEKNILWGQKGNYLLVPTDCPQRNERMGWTGDAQVFAATAAYHMDVLEFTRKWLKDLREGQLMYNKNGGVPDTAPLGGDNRKAACGGWGDAAVIVPWELYMEYGDKTVLEENYDMMAKWIGYQERPDREVNGIQVTQPRGDHLAFDTSTPSELCATAYAAYVALLMSKVAVVLGKEADAKKYAARYEFVKEAFNKEWVNEDGSMRVPSQTAYSLAIDFGLVEGVKLDGAGRGLVKAIEERDMHLSVGFLGIAHLLPALTKVGRDDIATALLFQKGNPSWLYSVLNGATTIWERWNSYIAETDTFGDVNMNSFNHYAYGAVGDWMYQNILGIIKETPNYDKFTLAPKPIGELTYAKGWHKCGHGLIASSWKLEGDIFKYIVMIPDGVEVKVVLPNGETYIINEADEYEYQVTLA